MTNLKLVLLFLTASLLWIGFVIFTGFRGWWMSPIAREGDVEGFLAQALAIVEADIRGNFALVLIEEGRVVAEHYSSLQAEVNADTVFSTASMSKWLTAHAVMKLVQDGEIELDKPVASYLTRWKLPENGFDNNEVTVRRLLSHTAGLADGLGFGDYLPEEELPSLVSSLQNPRASSGRAVEIGVSSTPGEDFNYSGGGYLILELLVEEVSGLPFEAAMQEAIFTPLGMERSGYQYIGDVDNNAGSYNRDGTPAPLYKYASNAATAFNSSPNDLIKFVRAQLPATSEPRILERDFSKMMRQSHGKTLGIDIWGLGTILYAPSGAGDFVFGHDGGNDPAINTIVRINPANSDALIVLETGHPSLATNLGSHWVFWQTGFPDALNATAVLRSLRIPMLAGLLILILLFGFYLYRLSSKSES